jgi:hypothetical protein
MCSALAWSVPRAGAAEYAVQQCIQGFNHDAEFLAPTNRPDVFYAANQCAGGGGFLLGAVWGQRVSPGEGISAITWAPDGTTFRSFRASMAGNATTGILLWGHACADIWCASWSPTFLGLQNWPERTEISWSGSAAALRSELLCTFGGSGECGWGIMPALEIFQPYFVLDDAYAPSNLSVTGGSLTTPGWKGFGGYTLTYAASDRGGGVAEARVRIDGVGYDGQTHTPPCAGPAILSGSAVWLRMQPCPTDASGTIPVDLTHVPDGVHQLTLEAKDPAGQTTVIAPFPVHVDNTSPTTPTGVRLDGGDGWRREYDFVARWENPVERYAPIEAAHWRICPVAGGSCSQGRKAGRDINVLGPLTVPSEGEYDLAVWLEDAAGNHSFDSARHARMRVDREAPSLAFEEQDPSDPTRVSVRAEDRLSGVAAGEIELRRMGGNTWHTLPANVEPGQLVAHVDDERFARGSYELRARAIDYAGNESSTARRASGSTMSLRLPLRIATRLRVRGRWGRHFRRRGRAAFGKLGHFRGRLTNGDGQPIDDAEIQVLSRPRLAPGDFALVGMVRTGKRGRFNYAARASEARVLRFRYPGSSRIMGATRELPLVVPGDSSLRVSDRSIGVGAAVVFSGRLRTRPPPPGGKLVEMQAFFRGRWRTFSTIRTDRRGRWRFKYRFGGTVGRVRYRFRVRLPREGGWRFDTGASRTVSVLVRGL